MPERYLRRYSRSAPSATSVPYFVSKLKTVGDRFCCAVDAHVDTFDAMILDATIECFAGQMNDSQWWIGDRWSPGFLTNCNPNFKRVLGREPMEPKRRQKAAYAMRNPLAGLSQTALLAQVRVCKGVESATDAL